MSQGRNRDQLAADRTPGRRREASTVDRTYEKSTQGFTLRCAQADKEVWERHLGSRLPTVVRQFLSQDWPDAPQFSPPKTTQPLTAKLRIPCTPAEKFLYEMAFNRKLAAFIRHRLNLRVK